VAASRKPSFKGELARPIRWKGPETRFPRKTIAHPPFTEDELRRHEEAWLRARQTAFGEVLGKLILLRRHYHIPEDTHWPLLLALRLAWELLPVFRIKYHSKGAGRKRVWDPLRYTQLIADVEEVKRERACGDREACRILVQRSRPDRKRYEYLPQTRASIDTAARSLEAWLVEARLTEHNPLFGLFTASDPGREAQFLDVLVKNGGPLRPKGAKI
jgi:hypothetical protein